MTVAPALKTVLTVVSGGASVRTREFRWGESVQPFSAGRAGEWQIEAPGVEGVHVFFGFDGRQVHVASASPSSGVWLNGIALGQSWSPIPVGAELRFGGACIQVTCEDIHPTAVAPPPQATHAPVVPTTSPLRTQVLAEPGAPGPHPAQASAPVAPMQPAGDKARVLGIVSVQTGPSAAPAQPVLTVATAPSAPLSPGPLAELGRTAVIQPSPVHTPAGSPGHTAVLPPGALHIPGNPGQTAALQPPYAASTTPQAPQAPQALQPPPQGYAAQTPYAPQPGHYGLGHAPYGPVGQGHSAPLAPGHAGHAQQQPGYGPAPDDKMTTAPSVRRALHQTPEEDASGVTVSDDGALRDLAAQVAHGAAEAAQASAEAYAAHLRRKAEAAQTPGKGVAAPEWGPSPPAHGAPGVGYNAGAPGLGTPPGAAQQAVPGMDGPAFVAPGAVPPGGELRPPQAQAPGAPKPPSKLAQVWRETSWVKKVTVVLLPVAGYFAVLWEPPAPEAPKRARTAASTKPASSGSAALAPTSAPSTAAPNASAVQAPPIASGGRAISLGVGGSPSPASAATGARLDKPGSKPAPVASATPDQREAFTAAFEGRLAEAAARYERLAEGENARVYSLAARLARERAVRKP